MPRSKHILLAAGVVLLVAVAATLVAGEHAHDNLCGRVCAACHIAPLATAHAGAQPDAEPPAPLERLSLDVSLGHELDCDALPAASRAPPASTL